MAKYREARAGIKECENWTIQLPNQTIWFPWIGPVLLWQEARPTTNPGHSHSEIQKVRIVVNRSII
jgi:hypothetical protein